MNDLFHQRERRGKQAVPSLPVAQARTERGEQRRRLLLDEAVRQFAERGYHGTSVNDIIDAVAVGKGSFYWHFESKEQLFREVLGDALQELRRTQAEALGTEGDPVRRLEVALRSVLSWLDGHRDLLDLLQAAVTDDVFGPVLDAGQDAFLADLAAHVKDGIVAGRIADGDPDVLARALFGVVKELAATYLRTHGEWDQRTADTAVAFCLGGLLSPRDWPATA
jgi:AcrR family transcriptional regulator